MTSFFYVVPIAFHTSVPALGKCMINSKKKKIILAESAATRAPGRGESVTELTPFMNFLVQSYTYCSDRHASPYWNFILRWISMSFTPSVLKKRMTDAVLLWCMLQAGPPFLHYYCALVLHFCIVLPPVGHSSNHEYRCCQLKKNRAVFRIYIAILSFPFASPSYIPRRRIKSRLLFACIIRRLPYSTRFQDRG